MIHKIAHFAAYVLNNPYTLAPLCMALVFVPVLGMWAVHKYGWEHWAPFDRGHKQGYTQYIRDWNASWLASPREQRIGIQPTRERDGNSLEPVSVILQDITDALFTGCSSVWQSTRFGSEWPKVQILSPRFAYILQLCIFILWSIGRSTGKL